MRPLRVGIIGTSIDLGLLCKTHCAPGPSLELWLLLLRLIPSIMIWAIGTMFLRMAIFWPIKERRHKHRIMSHKLFSFLLSPENFHEQDDGFLMRLENLFQRPLEVTNLSRIGHSMQLAAKHKEQIPTDQDILFLDLGAMDFINRAKCSSFRAHCRDVLEAAGSKNPDAHIILISPPDFVTMLSSPLNSKKAFPLPFSLTVGDLQRLEGFQKHLGLSASSSPEKIAYCRRLLELFLKIMQHELQRAQKRGVIRSASFIDGLKIPMYRPEDRSRYFAWDGLHLTTESARLVVSCSWPMLAKDLQSMQHLAPTSRDVSAARTVNQALLAPVATLDLT